jgi:formylmethanofuran dehydrogenase subunit B
MSAWIRGHAAQIEDAVEAAAASLAAARSPVIAGLSADVDALRAAFRLGTTIGASFDPVSADSLYGELAALAGAGAMTTTPGEAAGRADLVLAVGSRAARSPLVDRLRATEPTIGGAAGRRSVLILVEQQGAAPDNLTFPVESGGLAPALGLLRALASGRLRRDHKLADLAGILREARFGVAVYDPAELGELAVEMLQGLVVDLNETTRFFTVPLADPWQGRSLLQIGAWTAGVGPRVGFGRSYPEHDPWRFDAHRQAEAGEIDAVLWLASVEAPQPPWTQTVPSVALLGQCRGDEGDVVIAVGIPGETIDGVLWDERRASLVHRRATRPDERPSATAVLGAIDRAVRNRRSG